MLLRFSVALGSMKILPSTEEQLLSSCTAQKRRGRKVGGSGGQDKVSATPQRKRDQERLGSKL